MRSFFCFLENVMRPLKSIAILSLLALISLTFFGCAQNSFTPKPKAHWLNDSVDPGALKPTAQKQALVQPDFNAARKDLGLIIPPPGEDSALPVRPTTNKAESTASEVSNSDVVRPAIHDSLAMRIGEQLARLYKAQQPYDPALVKKWIDAIRAEDLLNAETRMESQTLNYGNGQSIKLLNESKRLAMILEVMLVKKGVAEITTPVRVLEDGRYVYKNEAVRVNIGGDLIPSIAQKSFVDETGQPCSSVICVLTGLFGNEEAAYDVLFVHLKFKYIVGVMIPRKFTIYYPRGADQANEEIKKRPQDAENIQGKWFLQQRNEYKYQALLKDFVPMTPEQIRTVAEALWILPPNYHSLASVLTFLAARKNLHTLTYSDGSQENTAIFQKQSTGAFYQELSNGQFPSGYIVFNSDSFNHYEIKNMPVEIKDPKDLEIYRQKVENLRHVAQLHDAIHELSHALDAATPLEQNGLSQTKVKSFGEIRWGLSGNLDWLALSPWYYTPAPTCRTVPANYTLMYSFFLPASGVTRFITEFTGCGVVINDSNYSLLTEDTPEFISAYAKTNPVEDFAESAAYSITMPSLMKKLAPSKYDYVTRYVLKGRNYKDLVKMEYSISTGSDAKAICAQAALENPGISLEANPEPPKPKTATPQTPALKLREIQISGPAETQVIIFRGKKYSLRPQN